MREVIIISKTMTLLQEKHWEILKAWEEILRTIFVIMK